MRQRKGCQSVLLWEEEGLILNYPDEYFDTCGETLVDCQCSEQRAAGGR
jgi:hypothetical protein